MPFTVSIISWMNRDVKPPRRVQTRFGGDVFAVYEISSPRITTGLQADNEQDISIGK